MNNPYQELISKMNRFNAWEKQYNKNLSPDTRLNQFRELFELSSYMPKEVVQKAHDDHLKHLIETQSNLKRGYEKGG